MIEVLIVDDSPTISGILEFMLNEEPGMKVIGNVRNGREAIGFVEKRKPDIIIMDVYMPLMNGIEATKVIMSTNPVPIIVFTSCNPKDKDTVSMEALSAGALALMCKPQFSNMEDSSSKRQLVQMIKAYSQVKVVRRSGSDNGNSIGNKNKKAISIRSLTEKGKFLDKKYLAIGCSSGGPQVLKKVLSKISKEFPYPIVIVQHISPGFLDNMVDWLNDHLNLPLQIAKDETKLKSGNVYFAPDNVNMGVKNGTIQLKESKNEKICPSVAYLFKSLTGDESKDTIGMILTGMGSDGSSELKKLKDAGAVTVAQDKESSLVFGMPGKAIQLGAADYILNPDQIADTLKWIEKNN